MCYYDQYEWACKDWKWGNFREHCQKEYRMGETCGMRLVYDKHMLKEKCRLCEKVETKTRRIKQEQKRIDRWVAEGSQYPASIEKSQETITQLQKQVDEALAQRAYLARSLGANRR